MITFNIGIVVTLFICILSIIISGEGEGVNRPTILSSVTLFLVGLIFFDLFIIIGASLIFAGDFLNRIVVKKNREDQIKAVES